VPSHSAEITFKKNQISGRRWLIPVILATQEVEIRKTVVQSQPMKIVGETLF
jgi:hypothetical protein